MADQVKTRVAERISQRHDIRDQFPVFVVLDAAWTSPRAVAPLVGGKAAIALIPQAFHEARPHDGSLRKAMQEDDRLTGRTFRAGRSAAKDHPVGLDFTYHALSHLISPK